MVRTNMAKCFVSLQKADEAVGDVCPPETAGREVAFIDTSVENWQTLAADIAGAKTGVEVVPIGAAENGLNQMADWASTRSGYDAAHILGHGSEGSLTLGSVTLTRSDLLAADVRAALAAIGRALTSEGDLLIYGCRVAEGDEGVLFLADLAEATGARVAGSTTLTGATDLGGDWMLQAQIGAVRTAPLMSASFPGVLAAPTIGTLDPVVYVEGDAAKGIGGVAFAGGMGYGGGSIRFEVGDPNSGDALKLVSAADGNAAGAVSVDPAGTVYLGNGTGRDAIGTVDPVENGQNGQALKINFTPIDTNAISNASFENGTTGWTIGEDRVILGSTVINGHVTPDDLTDPPNSGNDAGGATMTYDSETSTTEHSDGASSLRLFNSGTTGAPYDVVHGPYAYSNTFASKVGDILLFDWKAAAGGDAYDAFGYLMNADTGEHVTVLNATGADASGVTNWATASVVVPKDGNWFFTFVSGTYDFTGGRGVGGSLYVDNFKVVTSSVTDAVLSAIAGQVAYESTTDKPLPSRMLTVDVADGSGNTVSADTTLNVTNTNDTPTGSVQVMGDAVEDAVLTATNNIVDPDGPSPLTVSYQWQRQDDNGNWVNIDGATGANYTLTQGDVGAEVRAVASYTDAGGAVEGVASTPTTAVGNINDAPSGSVAVDGIARLGSVLTASHDISDPDGIGPDGIAYQWQRQDAEGNWVDIDGAIGATYTLAPGDLGAGVRAVAKYTDLQGTAESVPSSATGAIQPPMYYLTTTGNHVDSLVEATAYSGPVSHLTFEFAGSSNGEAVVGTAWNDFIHLGASDDAADGGVGNDVLDGGTGSNFLTGGAGQDIFFLDGRSGGTTWSTITDWKAGEQLALWGWKSGVSQATWIDDGGVNGYRGVTMHADINGDGGIDTSVTWAGLTRADLPMPIQQDGLLWFT